VTSRATYHLSPIVWWPKVADAVIEAHLEEGYLNKMARNLYCCGNTLRRFREHCHLPSLLISLRTSQL